MSKIKLFKRVISGFIATVMLMSVVPVFATDTNQTGNNSSSVELFAITAYNDKIYIENEVDGCWRYDWNTKTLYVYNCKEDSKSHYGWYACGIDTTNPNRITNKWESTSNTNIKRICEITEHIIVSNNVTEIGTGAFDGTRFPKLKSLVLPLTITKIGKFGLNHFDFVTLGTNMNVFKSVTDLGYYALNDCIFGDVSFDNLTNTEAGFLVGSTFNTLNFGSKMRWFSNEGLKGCVINSKELDLSNASDLGYELLRGVSLNKLTLGKNLSAITHHALDDTNIKNIYWNIGTEKVMVYDYVADRAEIKDVWFHGTEAMKNSRINWQNEHLGYQTSLYTNPTWHYVDSIEADDVPVQYYSGTPVTPALTIKEHGWNEHTLVEGTDYTVTYSNNDKAGTGYANITYSDDYTLLGGPSYVSFEIKEADVKYAAISNILDQTYTGNAIEPNITVKLGSETLVRDTDYTVYYSNNYNVGEASAIVTGIGKYKGNQTKTFAIIPRNAEDLTVTNVNSAYPYTGEAIDVEPIVSYNGRTLTEGVDYTVTRSSNLIGPGYVLLYINGKGNYTNSKAIKYLIESDYEKGLKFLYQDGDTLTYNYGLPLIDFDKFIVQFSEDSSLKLSDITRPIDESSYTESNYSGVYITTEEGDGTLQEYYDDDDGFYFYKDAGYYAFGAYSNVDVYIEKWYNAYIKPDYGYSQEFCNARNMKVLSLPIQPIAVDGSEFSFECEYTDVSKAEAPQIATYTGHPIEITNFYNVSLMKNFNGEMYNYSGAFDFSYQDNINVGTGQIVLTAKPYANFTGTFSKPLEITPLDITTEVPKLTKDKSGLTCNYAGANTHPEINSLTITNYPDTNGDGIAETFTLINGRDFTVDDTSIRSILKTDTESTMNINLMGNFTGTMAVEYSIENANLSDTSITVDDVDWDGTNNARPSYTISHNGTDLEEGADFEVVSCTVTTLPTMTENGQGKIIFRGLGRYEGTVEKTFVVKPKNDPPNDINDVSMRLVNPEDSEKEYTGSAITPEVILEYDANNDGNIDYILKEGIDYTLEYINNIEGDADGNATITATGIESRGCYGTKSITFKISSPDLSRAEIEVIDDQEYRKIGVAPEPTITLGGKILVKDTDFEYEYSNNMSVGTATVKIKGKGKYIGENSANFTIVPRYGGGNRFFMVILDLDQWQ